MERDFLWHWLNSLYKVSYLTRKKLLETVGDVEQLYECSKNGKIKELLENINEHTVLKKQEDICFELESPINRENAKKTFEYAIKNNIKICSNENMTYPQKLRDIKDPPFVLYYKGRMIDSTRPTVSIIGARDCSIYGKEMAEYFAKKLSESSISIVSGMARGIDGFAQKAALISGISFGILGCGVDICYPASNRNIYDQIIEKGGIISEETPMTKAEPFLFPKRNRIISALSDILLVVEAREKSGTLITAGYALEQGKEVYAIPGRVSDELSYGTNRLIRDGAFPALCPEDIILHLKAEQPMLFKNDMKKVPLETNEKIVYSLLSLNPMHFNTIVDESGLSSSEVSYILIKLELEGLIRQIVAFYYVVNI